MSSQTLLSNVYITCKFEKLIYLKFLNITFSDNLTPAMALLCVLYLANEKDLELVQENNDSDFIIRAPGAKWTQYTNLQPRPRTVNFFTQPDIFIKTVPHLFISTLNIPYDSNSHRIKQKEHKIEKIISSVQNASWETSKDPS